MMQDGGEHGKALAGSVLNDTARPLQGSPLYSLSLWLFPPRLISLETFLSISWAPKSL